MPGAEGRTGWPWDAFPWQVNWGFIILELSPFLMLLFILVLGSMSNRFKVFRRKRGAAVEDFAGAVQENSASPVPYFLIGVWLVVGVAVLIYTLNNGIFGEQY